MRVLFLSVAGHIGGAERVLLDSLAALTGADPRMELGVLSAADGPLVAAVRALGVRADVIPFPDAVAGLGESGRSPLAMISAAAGLGVPLQRYRRRLAAYLATAQPTLVHSHGLKMHLLTASLASGLPVLWHLHDYPSARAVSARLLRWAVPRAAGVIAPSRSVASDARAVFGGDVAVTTVHNAVDLGRYTPDGPALDLDACAGLPRSPLPVVRIGLVATYARWKGHDVFLRALTSLAREHPWRAYVIGGPVYRTRNSQVSREDLRARADALGLGERVGFVEFLPDTAPAVRALDVVVHASTSPEPFGLTVAEAMAAGRAVVVSATGGVVELFEDGEDALSFPAGDADALAAALARLIGDAALRRRLAARARVGAERRFGLDRFGAELVACYERTAARLARAGALAC